jgi:uncharacterized membrane protein
LPSHTPGSGDPAASVLARAKAAIAAGDRAGALALLRVLLDRGPEAAAALTPVLAEALIATARRQADERDRTARRAYRQAQAARAEICRLLATTPLDGDDLAAIHSIVHGREQHLQAQAEQRVADQPAAGEAGDSRRLGAGWLERYRGVPR